MGFKVFFFLILRYRSVYFYACFFSSFSDPPEIEVEKDWVHTGEGREAELVCIVHAEPPAEVGFLRIINAG